MLPKQEVNKLSCYMLSMVVRIRAGEPSGKSHRVMIRDSEPASGYLYLQSESEHFPLTRLHLTRAWVYFSLNPVRTQYENQRFSRFNRIIQKQIYFSWDKIYHYYQRLQHLTVCILIEKQLTESITFQKKQKGYWDVGQWPQGGPLHPSIPHGSRKYIKTYH